MSEPTKTFGGIRTLPAADLAAALAAKRGRTVSVCIPCRDEAGTVGSLVTAIRHELVGDGGLVDELLVVDDRSTDGTAAVAARAGARVVPIEEVHALHGVGWGKGNALWAGLAVSSGDVVVYLDGDLTSFAADWVVRLAAPLLADDSVALVKAHAHRPTTMGGGGRTTELVARPLISLYFPELAGLHQPLAGEYAVRRSVVGQLPFVQGWGVEIALLIDIARRHGPEAIAQVDVGVREHRHRPLESLAVQAAEVAATALGRAGALGEPRPVLRRADGSELILNIWERPPLHAQGG
ncbi:MAG TPA: glucosyl-3-phosphoglycerate synthase [Ilumatobacter sp.]|nr:glucosyl-3-phosphoglycerate synthase [Ilumatobacter sp.]